ncbi:restriction endonuclease subunit S [Methanobrevibacter smithii]|uniref:restriction endonuclease subunit S n=1 Tax=Methanobrevibacter smithii TaxID=2173 RepID=UPI0037DC5168
MEIGIPLLSAKDIFDGKININENSRLISIDDYNTIHKNYELTKGDILLTIVGTIGRTAMVNMDEKFTLQRSVAILRVNEQISYNFLYYYIQTSAFQNRLKSVVNQSAQGGVYLNSLKKLNIKLTADMNEQNKISSFLSIIDKKIELLEQKYQYYQEFKKYLMQQIFTQKLRFKNDKQWNVYLLRNFINEYNERMGNKSNLPILSSTLNGIFLQNEYFNKSVSSKDVKNYKIVPNGYFTYRSMSDTDKFRFNIQSIVEVGIISPAYPVFSTQNIDDYFLYYYLNNSNFIKKQILSLKEGGTRYALSFSKFKKLKISLPSLEEQEKIANFLSAVDKKIDLIQTQIQKMEEFKKGLLQQMFVVRINWRCNFKLAKSPSFNKHLLILKNKIIFIIIK